MTNQQIKKHERYFTLNKIINNITLKHQQTHTSTFVYEKITPSKKKCKEKEYFDFKILSTLKLVLDIFFSMRMSVLS